MDLATYRKTLHEHLSAFVTEQSRASLKLGNRLTVLDLDAKTSRLDQAAIDQIAQEETARALNRLKIKAAMHPVLPGLPETPPQL